MKERSGCLYIICLSLKKEEVANYKKSKRKEPDSKHICNELSTQGPEIADFIFIYNEKERG